MWLFLLFMCFSYLNAVLHGGGGTSTPSSNANGPEDSIRQNYPQYANMPFNDVHLQELFKTLPNYPIRTPTISVDVSRIEDWVLQNNPNCANITFENGHLAEVLKLMREYPIKNFTKSDSTQKLDKIWTADQIDSAAIRLMQEKCLEIVKSQTPNLDNNKLIEICQKEVNEYHKRCDERNKNRQKIFTSPDNPFNKANPIPLPQFSSLQQPRAHPLTIQLGGVQYALPRVPPPVPHVLAQNFLNHQKKSNPHYAKMLPLPAGIQNQPQPSRFGTNQQQIITPTNAQNQQQQTQHDKTTIPFHQQSGLQAHSQHISGQNQQIHQQHHVVEVNHFHPINSLNQQQVQYDRTNIPYPPIVGHTQQHVETNNPSSQTIGNIHQQPQNVETNIPSYPISGLNQKQMHQQHVETNNHYRTKNHNEDDAIVEKRTLDEYEHMPQNVAKKGKSAVHQHGGDFVGYQEQGLGTQNLQPHPIFDTDFVNDDDFGGLMQILHKHQKQINKDKNVAQNQQQVQQIVGGEQSDQRFLQNNHVDYELYGNNTEKNREIHHPPIMDLTSPSNSQQEQHSSEPTLSPQTPIKNPIQLNRDRLFKSPLSNVSTPLEGPASDPLALSENDPRMTLSAGHLIDQHTTNNHVFHQMSLTQNEGAHTEFQQNPSTVHPFHGNDRQHKQIPPLQNNETPNNFGHKHPSNFALNDLVRHLSHQHIPYNTVHPHINLSQNEGAQLGLLPNPSTLHPHPHTVQQQQLLPQQNQNIPRIFGHQQPSNQLNHTQFYQNHQSQNLVNQSNLNIESLELHTIPDPNTNQLPYNFHEGIHGFNHAGENGMPGSSSQMPHPTHKSNYGSLIQPGQHSFQQAKQPPPPQDHSHSQAIESITPPSSNDYTSSHDGDSSDFLGEFEDYSKLNSLDDIFEKNVLTSQHP